MVEALLREDAMRLYAGDPKAVRQALDNIDDFLAGGESGDVVALHDAARDAAWAELGGDG